MGGSRLSSIVRNSVVIGVVLCGTIFAQVGGGAPVHPAPAPAEAAPAHVEPGAAHVGPAPAHVEPTHAPAPDGAQHAQPVEEGAQAEGEPQQVAEEPAEQPQEEGEAPAEEVVQAPPVEETPAPPQAAEPPREMSEWDKKAKNIITVDFGPTVLALGLGQAFSLMNYLVKKEYRKDVEAKGSGFGFGVQYIRRLPYNLAAGVRFDYLTTGPKIDVNKDVLASNLYKGDYQEFNFTAYYFEGHCRYYPLAKGFFVDGNFSFGNVILSINQKFSEPAFVFDRQTNNPNNVVLKYEPQPVETKYAPAVSVIKLGPAFGLSETLGKNGGFVVEVSFGYQFGIPVSKTITDRVVEDGFLLLGGDDDTSKDFFDYTEKFLFMGGPRLATSVGWSF